MTHPAREHNRKEKDPAGIRNQDLLNTSQTLSLLSQWNPWNKRAGWLTHGKEHNRWWFTLLL